MNLYIYIYDIRPVTMPTFFHIFLVYGARVAVSTLAGRSDHRPRGAGKAKRVDRTRTIATLRAYGADASW